MSAELTPDRIKSIVSLNKPGFEVEEEDLNEGPNGTTPSIDPSFVLTNAPDLRTMAKKFVRVQPAPDLPPGESAETQVAETPELPGKDSTSKIVRVRPSHDRSLGAAKGVEGKVVVVSAKEGKIVGEQG